MATQKSILQWCCFLAFSLTLGLPPSAVCDDLAEFSIAQLMSLDVTSPGKKLQKVSEVPSAISVITAEDIRRSGATTIPEVLRLVPGVYVARISSNMWAVTARGMNDRFSNFLLVLIDGRTVYTPLFSGVLWDTQDVMMEDIDRIEVIRGPGATLWGANAVNGVVNIITKSSKDTQGGLMSGGVGNEERGFAASRFGGKLGEDSSYRGYVKWFERDEFEMESGSNGQDAWHGMQGGLRSDAAISERDSITLQGDAYAHQNDVSASFQPQVEPFAPNQGSHEDTQGANVLGRWTRTVSDTSNLQVAGYYDYMKRNEGILDLETHTFDLDFQHRFQPLQAHDVIWGSGYRYYEDKTDGNFVLSYDPDDKNLDLYTGFIQDDITLVDNTWRLVVGSKIEHNDFTGFEFQPNVRTIWTPDDKNSIWLAGSRAVRTPSRADEDIRFISRVVEPGIAELPTFGVGLGNPEMDAVTLYAIELGYRSQLRDDLSVDIATFYNYYDDMNSGEIREQPYLENVPPPPHIIVPLIGDNLLKVESHGVEASVDWRAASWWRLVGNYTYTNLNPYGTETTDPGIFSDMERDTPFHQFSIRSLVDLPYDVNFDSMLRFVDNTSVSDEYYELDLRLGWEALKNLELSVVGQNLLQSEHLEWDAGILGQPPVEVERGVYGKLTYRFS